MSPSSNFKIIHSVVKFYYIGSHWDKDDIAIIRFSFAWRVSLSATSLNSRLLHNTFFCRTDINRYIYRDKLLFIFEGTHTANQPTQHSPAPTTHQDAARVICTVYTSSFDILCGFPVRRLPLITKLPETPTMTIMEFPHSQASK